MSVRFRKALIDDVRYEAASVFDVNNDGALDIVCGEYWYEGPDWVKHKICDVQQEGEYYDDFSDLPMDVNGDGYIDIVTGGWFGEVLRWRENPGGKSPENWRVHDIARCGNIETTRLFDVDGDGELEIVPNTPGTRQAWYKLVRDADGKGTGRFEKHVIAASPEPSGHGLGFGDVNGDGRKDIVLCSGWLEAPEDRVNGKWTFHNEFDLRAASIEILVYDVNGDGLTDLVVGQAHDYGLDWWEQGRDGASNRTWTRHEIDPRSSQYHDLQLADIDRDGEPEVITGKRYRAHNGNDPGTDDPTGIYYFKFRDGTFEKHVIDCGPVPEATGCGIHFALADINGNGRLDIVAAGKDGLYLFENLGT